MACTLAALNTGTCSNSSGGALYAYATSAEYISAITVTSGIITGITMTTTDKWWKLTPNKNQTCRYDETGERPSEFSTRLTYACEGFAYFAGKNNAAKLVADAYGSCCQLVVIWVLGNGERVVQGIEIDASAAGGFVTSKEAACRCTPSLLSDTAANEARLELLFNSRNSLASPYTDLTDTEIEAL